MPDRWETKPVKPDATALWSPWLATLATHFPDAAAFQAWQAAIADQAIRGDLAVQGLWRDGALEGGLVVQPNRGHSVVLIGLGNLDADGFRAAIAALQAASVALSWDAATGPDWVDWAAGLGIKPFERQAFIQDLALVPPTPVDTPGLRPWEPTDRAAVTPLLAGANARTLDGLFLTLPEPPDEAACAAVLGRLLDGPGFLPGASFVVSDGQGIAAVVLAAHLAVDGTAEVPTLFELAVAPRARGQGLARVLVARLQAALRTAGHTRLGFLTTHRNAPVHRLYHPDQIVWRSATHGGYWIRDEVG